MLDRELDHLFWCGGLLKESRGDCVDFGIGALCREKCGNQQGIGVVMYQRYWGIRKESI